MTNKTRITLASGNISPFKKGEAIRVTGTNGGISDGKYVITGGDVASGDIRVRIYRWYDALKGLGRRLTRMIRRGRKLWREE